MIIPVQILYVPIRNCMLNPCILQKIKGTGTEQKAMLKTYIQIVSYLSYCMSRNCIYILVGTVNTRTLRKISSHFSSPRLWKGSQNSRFIERPFKQGYYLMINLQTVPLTMRRRWQFPWSNLWPQFKFPELCLYHTSGLPRPWDIEYKLGSDTLHPLRCRQCAEG